MKKYVIFFIILISFFGCDQIEDYPGVAGKKYVGKPLDPVREFPESGFFDEGYGQQGYYQFSLESNNVDFIWPGNDIMDGGTYSQTELEVKINSMYGEVYYLTVSEDGIELVDNEFGTVYRDEKFPW